MSGSPRLLDVNVLVALFDSAHVHHEAAHHWFSAARSGGWATCPMTQAGFLRTLASPAYGPDPLRIVDLARRLAVFEATPGHVHWDCGPSLTDRGAFALERLTGHRQLTDALLLGWAVARGGRLATLDRGIPWKAVRGARAEDVAVIPA